MFLLYLLRSFHDIMSDLFYFQQAIDHDGGLNGKVTYSFDKHQDMSL